MPVEDRIAERDGIGIAAAGVRAIGGGAEVGLVLGQVPDMVGVGSTFIILVFLGPRRLAMGRDFTGFTLWNSPMISSFAALTASMTSLTPDSFIRRFASNSSLG